MHTCTHVSQLIRLQLYCCALWCLLPESCTGVQLCALGNMSVFLLAMLRHGSVISSNEGWLTLRDSHRQLSTSESALPDTLF